VTVQEKLLDFPLPDAPEPLEDCGVCQALVKQREEALAAGDWSRVTDCNVEIRNHRRRTPARRWR